MIISVIEIPQYTASYSLPGSVVVHMNVCTTGNFTVQYSSCTHTAVATGNVMFLFMALNQVVLCSLFPAQQKLLLYYKECYASFYGAQGVLLYHRKKTQNSP